MWVFALAIICVTGIFICEGPTIMNAVTNVQKKKIEEEHKTTNLALIYQILSSRPELTLEEVMNVIETKGPALEQIENKH